MNRIVQKDGPNKGRSFYGCAGSVTARCNFFKWDSDVDAGLGGSGQVDNGGNTSGWGQTGRGNGGDNTWSNSKKRKKPAANSKKKSSFTSAGTKGKRKCGLCGEEGNFLMFFNYYVVCHTH